MASDASVVRQIIKRYGKVIDLEAHPEVIIDIIRQFADDDGGSPPGGTPPTPPGPTSFQPGDPAIRDVLREVLKLQRQVAKLSKQIRS
jgi:hypothetical protein